MGGRSKVSAFGNSGIRDSEDTRGRNKSGHAISGLRHSAAFFRHHGAMCLPIVPPVPPVVQMRFLITVPRCSSCPPNRKGPTCSGHPRLRPSRFKAWMPGTSPGTGLVELNKAWRLR